MRDALAPSRGAVVLAGGESSRMGRDKASLPFGGETLLARVLRALGGAVEEVVVVLRPGAPDLDAATRAAAGAAPVRVARDAREGRGPVEGLAAGLRATRADAVFVCGADLPFLSAAFVRAMFEALPDDALAAWPAVDGVADPTVAVVRRKALAAVDAALALAAPRAERGASLRALYATLDAATVPEATLRAADPHLAALHDVDTPADWRRALDALGLAPPPDTARGPGAPDASLPPSRPPE